MTENEKDYGHATRAGTSEVADGEGESSRGGDVDVTTTGPGRTTVGNYDLARAIDALDCCERKNGWLNGGVTDRLRDALAATQATASSDDGEQSRSMGAEWRDIESAPKDGTHILALDQYGAIVTLAWGKWNDEDSTHWIDAWRTHGVRYVPTHWMPLPEPPSSESRGNA